MPKKVTVWSTDSCYYCKLVKDFLNKNHTPFEEINVSGDPARMQQLFEMVGSMSVPTVTIDRELVIGYNPSKIEQFLNE